MERRRSPRRTALALVAGGMLPLVGACDLLNAPGGEPERVTVVLESSDVSDVGMVTSMDFLMVPDPECPEDCPETIELVRADTTNPALPFNRTYEFSSQLQFFVEAFPATDQEVTLTMRVTIDGRVWYDNFRTLNPPGDDGEPETIRFVYRYSEGGGF